MKNCWYLSLVISFLVHTAFINGIPTNLKNIFSKKESTPKKKQTKKIRISPRQIETIIKKPPVKPSNTKPLPYVENIMSKLIQSKKNSPLQKLRFSEKNIKEIIFTEASQNDKDLKKHPAYMDYYRLIRERIRANAYHNYNSTKKGEVLINFLVEKDGLLKSADLDSRSVKDRTLRDIALKSVRESAPFPKFPEEISKYSHLQFNISIYFKNN